MGETRSLNGGKTRPLTAHSLGVLKGISTKPVARGEINAGVWDRLTREPNPLCEVVQLPSPFKKHKGGDIPHLQITAAGRQLLADRGV